MIRANAACLATAFLGFALPSFLPLTRYVRTVALTVGAIVLVGAILASRFRCPNCGKNIGGLFGNRACGFALTNHNEKPVTNCPRCGVSLDAPMRW
jgi:predicted RNA-binding Zn-ribbon protein involved in translation (DUF1610 family)